MVDPNIKDFYRRVGRLNKAHAKGRGFEAAGTLGRSHFQRRKRGGLGRLLMPLVIVVGAGFGLKAGLYYYIGADAYNDRVAALQQGEGFDKLGAVLMTPDKVTLWLSDAIRNGVEKQAGNTQAQLPSLTDGDAAPQLPSATEGEADLSRSL